MRMGYPIAIIQKKVPLVVIHYGDLPVILIAVIQFASGSFLPIRACLDEGHLLEFSCYLVQIGVHSRT